MNTDIQGSASNVDELPPADVLRQAVALIRETVAKATPGPWVNLDNGDRIIRALPAGTDVLELEDSGSARIEYVVDEPLIANPANGAHIVLMHPGVALAVAEMLEQVADDMDDATACELECAADRWVVHAMPYDVGSERADWTTALATARAILKAAR